MNRVFLTTLFFLSVFLLPWYLSVFLGLILITFFQAYGEVLVGAVLLDTLFGSSSFTFPFVYTGLFVILAISALALRSAMMER